MVSSSKDFIDDVSIIRKQDEPLTGLVQSTDGKNTLGVRYRFNNIPLHTHICGARDSYRLVIKNIDGNERAIPALIYKIFRRFKIMSISELRLFKQIYDFKITNNKKIKIGNIQTKF